MIEHQVQQGSVEWADLRLGIPTASQFHRILTPKTRKLSGQARKYVHELVAERLLDCSVVEFDSDWTARGKQLEPQAISFYEFTTQDTVRRVGFVSDDARTVGCSPDGLIGHDGGLELKCPDAANHVANLLDDMDSHNAQVQGCMWITGRSWWDVVSFNPVLPPAIVRIERDDDFIEALAEGVRAVNQMIADAIEKLSPQEKPECVPSRL